MISATAQTKRLQRRLAQLPRHLSGDLKKGLGRLGVRFHQFHRRERLKGPPGIKASGRRGGLVKQRKFRVSGAALRNLALKTNVRSRVAVDHEKGRTIRPARGGYLALPMPAAKKKVGGVSRVARRLLANTNLIAEARRRGRVARSKGGRRLQGLFVIQSGSRRFVARPAKKGSGDRPTLLFHLRRRVKLRKRLQYYKTFRRFMPRQGIRILHGSLRHAVRRSA